MQRLWKDHLAKHPTEQTECHELKITKSNRLEFDRIKDHQIEALLAAEDGFLYHRIIDQPWGGGARFQVKKPFDNACFYKARSYLVVWFYKPRQTKFFYKIPIKKFLQVRNKTSRKSLTEDMVSRIADMVYIDTK